jgi:hypothetical protein
VIREYTTNGEKKNACRTLARNPEDKRPFARTRYIKKDKSEA